MGLDNPIHIVLLLLIVALIFGAKRLPELGRSLGEGMRGFKESLSGQTPPQHQQLNTQAQPQPAPPQVQPQPQPQVQAQPQPQAPAPAEPPLQPQAPVQAQPPQPEAPAQAQPAAAEQAFGGDTTTP